LDVWLHDKLLQQLSFAKQQMNDQWEYNIDFFDSFFAICKGDDCFIVYNLHDNKFWLVYIKLLANSQFGDDLKKHALKKK